MCCLCIKIRAATIKIALITKKYLINAGKEFINTNKNIK